jgi:hypothetical protein
MNTIDDLGVLIADITYEGCLSDKQLLIPYQVLEHLLLSFSYHPVLLNVGLHLGIFVPELINITY